MSKITDLSKPLYLVKGTNPGTGKQDSGVFGSKSRAERYMDDMIRRRYRNVTITKL